jgi:hypothetical protein
VVYASPVHLIHWRKQRLIEHCVLPRRAWSQNGRVMYASPVHLIHWRKQRLMKHCVLPRRAWSPYRHQLLEHQNVFGAIVVLTQLSLAENPLFQVDYND